LSQAAATSELFPALSVRQASGRTTVQTSADDDYYYINYQ